MSNNYRAIHAARHIIFHRLQCKYYHYLSDTSNASNDYFNIY